MYIRIYRLFCKQKKDLSERYLSELLPEIGNSQQDYIFIMYTITNENQRSVTGHRRFAIAINFLVNFLHNSALI